MHPDLLCDYLDDYVDEDLAETMVQNFERHLATCEACRTELNELKDVDSLLRRAWTHVDLNGPDAEKAIQGACSPANAVEKLDKESAATNGGAGVRFMIAAALAASLLITVGLPWMPWFRPDMPVEVVDSLDAETIKKGPRFGSVQEQDAGSADRRSEGQDLIYETSYASAKFGDPVRAVKLSSSPEFTVYQVSPAVTFSHTN